MDASRRGDCDDARLAAEEATFHEKRTILNLLDVHVLCNEEMLELSRDVPVRSVDLEKILKGELTGGIFFSPASIFTDKRFSGGGKGHDQASLYAQYG